MYIFLKCIESIHKTFNIIVNEVCKIIVISFRIEVGVFVPPSTSFYNSGYRNILSKPISMIYNIPVKKSSSSTSVTVSKRMNPSDKKMENYPFYNGMDKYFLIIWVKKMNKFLHKFWYFYWFWWMMQSLSRKGIYYTYIIIYSEFSLIILTLKGSLSQYLMKIEYTIDRKSMLLISRDELHSMIIVQNHFLIVCTW